MKLFLISTIAILTGNVASAAAIAKNCILDNKYQVKIFKKTTFNDRSKEKFSFMAEASAVGSKANPNSYQVNVYKRNSTRGVASAHDTVYRGKGFIFSIDYLFSRVILATTIDGKRIHLTIDKNKMDCVSPK